MVFDVRNFDTEVIQRSHEIPVLVDFWAEWCGPCRVLSPILERLAARDEGKWILAKVNTEEHTDKAIEYGVSGIPAVKLFHEGNVIAEFVGALPEHMVQQWLMKVLPSKQDVRVEQARELLERGQTSKAQQLLSDVIRTEPENKEASILLARTFVFTDPAKALDLVRSIDNPTFSEQVDSIQTLSRLLDIQHHQATLPNGQVKEKYLAAIGDLQAQNLDAALEKFIDIIRTDRPFDDDGSRKACIAIFKYLGEEHPITIRHRREFSSALYV